MKQIGKVKSTTNTLKTAIIKEYNGHWQLLQNQSLSPEIRQRSNLRNYFYAQKHKTHQRPSTVAGNEQKRKQYRENSAKVKNQSQIPIVGMIKPFFINVKPGPKNMVQKKLSGEDVQPYQSISLNKISFKSNMNLRKSNMDGKVRTSIHEEIEKIEKIKGSYKNQRRNYTNEGRRKVQEFKREEIIYETNYSPDKDLNIRGLKTSQMLGQYKPKKKYENLISEEGIQNIENSQILKHNSNMNSPNPHRKATSSPQKSYASLNMIRQKQKKKTIKENILVDYLGKITPSMTPDEAQVIKVMYYKDLIWKIWFNYNRKYEGSTHAPRFYIGRGNNSRLIKSIMGKRWWWKIETKEENANFLWTQLKLYSIYQSQNSLTSLIQHENEQSSDNWNREKIQHKYDKNSNLLTEKKYHLWKEYIKFNKNLEQKNSQSFESRRQLEKKFIITRSPKKVSNHLQYSRLIGNKKALYKTMTLYQTLLKKHNKWLPVTYHITCGLEDDQYLRFLKEYYYRSKNLNNSSWIVKPGEMSNRGNGITVCNDLKEIKAIIKNRKTHLNGKPFTYIIQQYLYSPLLYHGRKFDLRHFIMITSVNGRIQGYFYQEGYLRTTSYKYTKNSEKASVHLTNDAVQKNCKDYGKYEQGNKVSYQQFDQYLQKTYGGKYNFYRDILPKIREICIELVKSCYFLIDPKRRQNNFEIFGLDIMIDQDFKLWLIEANTNPCLEISSKLLLKLIPQMIDNALMIAVDPLFPPPSDLLIKRIKLADNSINYNKFQLIFDQVIDGKDLKLAYQKADNQIKEMDVFGSDQQAYESGEDNYDIDY